MSEMSRSVNRCPCAEVAWPAATVTTDGHCPGASYENARRARAYARGPKTASNQPPASSSPTYSRMEHPSSTTRGSL